MELGLALVFIDLHLSRKTGYEILNKKYLSESDFTNQQCQWQCQRAQPLGSDVGGGGGGGG